LLGRDFSVVDTAGAPKVALINKTMEQYYFRGARSIGRHVTLGSGSGAETFEIVGVVKDSKYMTLREPAHRTIFTDCFQDATMAGSLTLELRTSGDPTAFVSAVRSAVGSLSNSVPVTDVGTLSAQVNRSITQERLVATLSGFFGGLALLLACIGLYGLMSYNVGTRTNEIGVRMALGAARGTVIRMVLREGLLLAAGGIVIGVPIALLTSHLAGAELATLLFGLSATSVDALVLACAALLVSAALASYIPARRASHVDPMVALRHE
jgi:predicted lysophospholipase L1 biosynthesis ABC-type transport system permease subunit